MLGLCRLTRHDIFSLSTFSSRFVLFSASTTSEFVQLRWAAQKGKKNPHSTSPHTRGWYSSSLPHITIWPLAIAINALSFHERFYLINIRRRVECGISLSALTVRCENGVRRLSTSLLLRSQILRIDAMPMTKSAHSTSWYGFNKVRPEARQSSVMFFRLFQWSRANQFPCARMGGSGVGQGKS